MKRKSNGYDLSKLTIDERFSDMGKRKVVDGIGYSEETYRMNKEILIAPREFNEAYGVPLEWQEQAELIRWFSNREDEYPDTKILFHVPNGEYRDGATAAKLEKMGVKPGAPDLYMDVARGGYFGWRGELKRIQKGKVSYEQSEWMKTLTNNGYYCVVTYGWVEAREAILWYLGLPQTHAIDGYFLDKLGGECGK